jgi:hypothetical protein
LLAPVLASAWTMGRPRRIPTMKVKTPATREKAMSVLGMA